MMDRHRVLRWLALLGAVAATAYLWAVPWLAAGGDAHGVQFILLQPDGALSLNYNVVLPLVLALLTAWGVWAAALVVDGGGTVWLLRSLAAAMLVAVGSAIMVLSPAWRVGLAFTPTAMLLLALVVYTLYRAPGLE